MKLKGKNNRGFKKIITRIFVFITFSCLIFFILHFIFPFRVYKPYSTAVYDRKGRLLHAYLSQDDKWRIHVKVNEVNGLMKEMLVRKEDRYFHYHPGINPVSILRAGINNLIYRKRTSGASTITMQVARMIEKRPRTFSSKIIEAFRALQLEIKYNKDEILEMYLNLLPYGGNIEGVKSASILYFGKGPELLSPAESVLLAIVPNRPSSLNPGKYNEKLVTERNKWLKRLASEKLIDSEELQDALIEDVNVKRKPLPDHAPHLSRRLKNNLYYLSEINSTIDLDIQYKVQQLCSLYLNRMNAKSIRNASIIVIDNLNSQVIAYSGSQDFNDKSSYGEVDGVTAVRSPGSALKPLVYALAFDKGNITPLSMMDDVPVNYNGYAPENFDSRFHGKISASSALAHSLNIPAVDLLSKITVPAFVDMLGDCGFKTIKKQKRHLGLSAILGGCGVSLEEMGSLYSAFANGGYLSPLKYVLSDTSKIKRQVCSESASYILTEILSKNDRPDLPNLFESSLHVPRIAWKTGTSYGRRDAWSIGFNKRYTVAVWAGNFDGTGVPELSGADIATPLLFQVFNSIDYNSGNEWFRPTKELDYRYVCPQTGNIPGEFCTDKVMDWYLPGISETKICDHIIEKKVSPDERISYCTNCEPEAGYKRLLYENPSPALRKYYAENHIPVKLPPEHNPACTRIFNGLAPQIISLSNAHEYIVEKEELKNFELSANVASDVEIIFWYVNDRFIGKCNAADKLFFTPSAGKYKISCTDDKGRNSDIKIEVRFL